MSTATMRLRRAGAGGLAAAVIAGTLVATAGSAFAWTTGNNTISVADTGNPVIAPGSTGSGATATVTLPTQWNNGDTLTIDLGVNGAAPTCAVTQNIVSFATAPTITASKGTGAVAADVLPTFTVALNKAGSGCSSANAITEAVITFTNNTPTGTPNTVNPTLTLTGHQFAVGSGITVGSPITLSFAAGGTNPAAAVTNSPLTNAVVGLTAVVSATPVHFAPTVSATVPTITVKESAAGSITGGSIAITIDNVSAVDTSGAKATWSGGSIPSTPAPTAWGGLSGTTATITVPLTGTTTGTTLGTFTLSGVKVTPVAPAPNGYVLTATADSVTGKPSAAVGADVTTKNTGGVDRYWTAKALYDATFAGPQDNVILASGALFPDALSANTLAGALNAGILLTTPTVLDQAAALAITAHNVKTVYIIGGTGAVSAAVATQIQALTIATGHPAVIRLGGADRYATNNVVDIFASGVSSPSPLKTTAIVATGANFADALAVGPQVNREKYPLVLTTTAALSPTAASTLTNLGIQNVIIVGGTGAVSSAVETSIKTMGINVAYRLAGTDRTQTAEQIATWSLLGVPATTSYSAQNALVGYSDAVVHVANGANFPDALAAGQYAGKNGQVILLSNSPTSAGLGGPAFVATMANDNGTNFGTVNGLGLAGAVSNSVLEAFALGILG